MLWQRRLVHGKAMVLGGDVAPLGSEVHHRLVHATIPKPTLSQADSIHVVQSKRQLHTQLILAT